MIYLKWVRLTAKASECKLNAKDLLEQRQLHSQRTEDLLLASIYGVPPGILLGKVLHCMSAKWPKLSLYATVDEDSIRPFVVDRRTWRFAEAVAFSARKSQLQIAVLRNDVVCCCWLKWQRVHA